MDFDLVIDKKGVWQRLDILGEREGVPEEVWDDVGTVMLNSIMQNFTVGGRPPWPPRKDKTGKPLLGGRSGSLARSTHEGSRGDTYIEIVSGTGLPYAFVQALGGTIKQTVTPRQAGFFYAQFKTTEEEMWLAMYIKYRPRKGRTAPTLIINIDPRQWMMFQEEDVENILQIFTNYFLGKNL
jgi:phage gpG-like protein